MLHHTTAVSISRDGHVRRRDFLKSITAAGAAAGALSWHDAMTANAAELRQRGKACILLWMQGGPSQFETFDPKPGHKNGGETKAIETAVSGIRISEHFPELASRAADVAFLRSLTSKEGSHPRATSLLHTGYVPTASIKYPTLGSIVSHEIGDAAAQLPSFVRIGGNQRNAGGGAGFLGVQYDPFDVSNPGSSPTNTKPATDVARYQQRLGLLDQLETDAGGGSKSHEAAEHAKLYQRAAKMILSPAMTAFNFDEEPSQLREAYGRSAFGSGCLLARRLVESGVTFVEVIMDGWDTHNDNFDRVKTLAGSVDKPHATLLADLKSRGLLNSTLVIWMGEFGRTPNINPRGGRDHFPRAFNAALAGGGVRGGQVIGATDASGSDVKERPVTVPDLFQTFCHGLGMNADKENQSPIGRPIRIVEGGQPVKELFG